eukprot:15469640-Alexandrium_andersonii.AAC.1
MRRVLSLRLSLTPDGKGKTKPACGLGGLISDSPYITPTRPAMVTHIELPLWPLMCVRVQGGSPGGLATLKLQNGSAPAMTPTGKPCANRISEGTRLRPCSTEKQTPTFLIKVWREFHVEWQANPAS